MGGKGGASTTTQKADPWSGVQPFLLGSQTTRLKQGVQPIYKQEQTWNPNLNANVEGGGGGWETKSVINNPATDYETVGSPGIFPEAQRLYQGQGWSQGMQDLTNAQSRNVAGRADQVAQAYQVGNQALAGAFDPKTNPAKDVAAQMVDPKQAFSSMGEADPTRSIQQMLTGQANTATLDPVVQSAFRRMGEGFNEQIMPGIRSNAIAAGQYGSSRQGIAEGLASKGLLYSMGDTAANMYNDAYRNAQNLMGSTANNMAGLSLNNSQANANRDLTAQTTNVQTQLANNQQAMQLAQQQLATRAQGLNLLGTGNSLQDQTYQQQMGLLNAPNDYNWQNLNKYASIVQPGAGMGSSQSSSQSGGSNPLAGAVGGAMTGGALFGASGPLAGALGITGPWGAAIGAGLGLLGGLK